MLTDDDRQRIRAEEAFRQEVRKELVVPAAKEPSKAPMTIWQRFMGFANTSFGIWLLSTVAIGGVSTGYQLLTHHFEMVRQDEARAARLNSEISNRLDQMSEKLLDGPSRTVVLDALKELDTGSVKMFDDLFEKNILTLLGQLHDLVGHAHEQQIDSAVAILRDVTLLNQRYRQDQQAAPAEDVAAFNRLKADVEKLQSLRLYKPPSARSRNGTSAQAKAGS